MPGPQSPPLLPVQSSMLSYLPGRVEDAVEDTKSLKVVEPGGEKGA